MMHGQKTTWKPQCRTYTPKPCFEHWLPAYLWQRATPVIVGWCAVSAWYKNGNWYNQLSQLLCNFYRIYKLANVAAGRGLESDDLGVQICLLQYAHRRSQWPRDLRRSSSAARLLRLWVRIRALMDLCPSRLIPLTVQ